MSSSSLERIRRRRRQDRLWFVVSLTLHAMALIALVYLTPVRELVRRVTHPTRPETSLSASVLMDLTEAIDERAAEQIRQNTQELDRVLEEMARFQENIAAEFAAFVEEQRNTAAADAVNEMERAIKEMESALSSIEQNAAIEQTDRFQALAEQAQQRAANKLAMAPFDVSAAATAQQRASDAHQQAKTAHDEDRRLKEQALAREATLEAERTRAEDRRKALEDVKAKEEPQQAEIDRAAKALEDQELRVAQALEALTTTQEEQQAANLEARDRQARAIEAQKKALAALQEAIQRHEQEMSGLTLAQRAAIRAQTQQAQAPATAYRAAAPYPTDVADLYDRARTSEDRIAESLKEIRAMDLAMVRDIELEDARDDIDVVRPVRPDLDVDLLREEVRTGQRFEAHKAEVRKALRETNSMVNLARQMLEMANQSVARMQFGTDAPMAEPEGPEAPDFELIIRELAMEDVSGRFSDMSAMMLAAEQQMAGAQRQAAGQTGAGARMRPAQDIEDLTQDVPGADSMAISFGQGEGAFPDLPPDVPAVGARRLTASGIPTQFMYIDSWYTIGPFPNPNRINIDREFPPDSLIDLDATYTGKNGRTIRWKFVQSDKPQMIPADPDQYGIWYAYTEFYCDRPRDVWIAAGTDDRGTLKINGVPVWISSKRLKGWDIDEVWRKVHLKQGINRILYRVENGWLHIGFSLTLKLDDQ